MKHILFILFLFPLQFMAQVEEQHRNTKTAQMLPDWAQLLYSPNPNAWEVRAAYEAYYSTHEFVKTIHTQNYKRWVNGVKKFVREDGSIGTPSAAEGEMQTNTIRQQQSSTRGGGDIWYFEGPEHHLDADGSLTPGFRHSNIYCHDRSTTNPEVLYCGTESGGAYKTTNAGANWEHVSAELLIGHVSAIRIRPTDENFVLMSAANDLWRTMDGGDTWDVIGQQEFVALDISAWEIAFHPEDPNMVFAATNEGFWRSTNLGDTWIEILPRRCETIAFQPGSPWVVYTIQYEDNLNYARFYKSIDYGESFTMYDSGWFDSSMGNIEIQGGRLATTEANPDRIYALLVGYQQAGSNVTTNGWVGCWVSDDAGQTWTLPHELIGTPYTEEHPNLMNFVGDDGDYSQIHYNTTMVASQLDADKVLIGGLNLWISNDGCATYEGVGGYIGGISYFHVDQQEYRIYKTSETTEEIWFSNDGGIGFSSDFMETHDNRNRGIQAVNLWGYDQGWNEDVMVGGRYHNGNMAYHENYADGEFLALGGGEAATGYVNYSDENKTYFSDINGAILPEAMNAPPSWFNMNFDPNESYWANNSSRIAFDNSYFNVAWGGRENKLYRSTNSGSSFNEFHSFGTDVNNWVLWIEQSYADANYIYLHQELGTSSKLWRTTDYGETWGEVVLPLTLREMVFTTSGTNPDELWVAYYYGNNGFKVYHTTNGGDDWDNITTSQMVDMQPWAIAHQYGTDGGVYLAMKNGIVFYKNNAMSDWESYSTGLPVSTEPLRIVPFYKEGVVRLACWNLGVWEAPLFEESILLADFAAEYGTYFCPGDPVHFVDHSVCSDEAIYSWEFPGATPSTSEEKYPTVVYNDSGTYDVTLTVADNGSIESVTKTAYISSALPGVFPLTEGFESGVFPESWKSAHSTGGSSTWAVGNLAGGYDESESSMYFDNYWNDVQGNRDEIWLGKLELEMLLDVGYQLKFDVAYAEYGWPYSDTLGVLLSTDCGSTWEEIYVKGGEELSTSAPTGDPFYPLAEEWRTDIIDFSEYLDYEQEFEEVIIAFQNRGRWGNLIYVDNINIDYVTGVSEELSNANISLFPNPTSGAFQLSADGLQPGEITLQIYDALGKIIHSEKIISAGNRLEKMISLHGVANGVYTLQLIGEGVNVTEGIEIR